jgi:hypothetical protein
MDPAVFPRPEILDPSRPRELYAILLGPPLLRIVGPVIAAMLKEVFKLKNIGRARGNPGQFATVEQEVLGIRMRTYLDANAREMPYPTNLMLAYEEEGVLQMNGNPQTNGHVHGHQY